MLDALLALMSPLWNRTPAEATDTSLSRILVVAATALFTVLVILLVDLHHDELRALGLARGPEQINAMFMSP